MSAYSFRFPLSCLSFIGFSQRKSKSTARPKRRRARRNGKTRIPKRNLHSLALQREATSSTAVPQPSSSYWTLMLARFPGFLSASPARFFPS